MVVAMAAADSRGQSPVRSPLISRAYTPVCNPRSRSGTPPLCCTDLPNRRLACGGAGASGHPKVVHGTTVRTTMVHGTAVRPSSPSTMHAIPRRSLGFARQVHKNETVASEPGMVPIRQHALPAAGLVPEIAERTINDGKCRANSTLKLMQAPKAKSLSTSSQRMQSTGTVNTYAKSVPSSPFISMREFTYPCFTCTREELDLSSSRLPSQPSTNANSPELDSASPRQRSGRMKSAQSNCTGSTCAESSLSSDYFSIRECKHPVFVRTRDELDLISPRPSQASTSASANPTKQEFASPGLSEANANADSTDEEESSGPFRSVSAPPAHRCNDLATGSSLPSSDSSSQLRQLRAALKARIYFAEQILEDLCAQWGEHYLMLAARKALEDTLEGTSPRTSPRTSPPTPQFRETWTQPSELLQTQSVSDLRAVLRDAEAAGIGESDDLVVRAEAALSAALCNQKLKEENVRAFVNREAEELRQKELEHQAVRSELHRAVALAVAGVEAGCRDIAALRELRNRLQKSLSKARGAGVPDAELRAAELQRRRAHNAMADALGQVRVCCRVRPLCGREEGQGDLECLHIIDDTTLVLDDEGSFSFDGVFAGGTEEIFDSCRDMVQSAVDGYNVTILAFGQTGAGKTRTIFGRPEEEGIAKRMITELFTLVENQQDAGCSMPVTASMYELYNNQVVDLFGPTQRAMQRRTTFGGGSHRARSPSAGAALRSEVDDVMEREVASAAELGALLDRGLARRATAAHALNAESSRSHAIFSVKVARGKITFCDLAGSERLKKTEAEGARRREAIEVNRSLTALLNVLEAVARGRKVVPYREHKLTQILQDSIGGTAKTLMVAHCSPASSCASETLMTLKFASRARKIRNSPVRNVGGARGEDVAARTPVNSPRCRTHTIESDSKT